MALKPSAENVDNGSYPLARPLFIYSASSIMSEKPQVADFINFYLTNVNEEVEDVGYFPRQQRGLRSGPNKAGWTLNKT